MSVVESCICCGFYCCCRRCCCSLANE